MLLVMGLILRTYVIGFAKTNTNRTQTEIHFITENIKPLLLHYLLDTPNKWL